jgi:uncharacterized repeat protein (TIGR01451 family)
MRRVLVLALLLFSSMVPTFAQTYFVSNFSNNGGPGPGQPDQVLRLINVGNDRGTPLNDPQGDVCANFYVFDANQEMISCCSCLITPNGLLTVSVGSQLTNNPVTSVVPVNGAIKIAINEPSSCGNPTTPLTGVDASLAVGFATHVQTTSTATFITEVNIPTAPLSAEEGRFLPQACAFVRYVGSGKGVCNCSNAAPTPVLYIAKSHTGNFVRGQVGATYTIVVSNIGQQATTGTVTLADVVPAGLTATAIIGTG